MVYARAVFLVHLEDLLRVATIFDSILVELGEVRCRRKPRARNVAQWVEGRQIPCRQDELVDEEAADQDEHNMEHGQVHQRLVSHDDQMMLMEVSLERMKNKTEIETAR